MTTLFEPNYAVLAFFFAQKFVYLELLALLSLTRTAFAQGASRTVAAAVALASIGLVTVIFAPALNLTAQPWYAPLVHLLNTGGGAAVPLSLSALFALSAVLPGRRLWMLDWIHAAGVAAFLGLWVATRI